MSDDLIAYALGVVPNVIGEQLNSPSNLIHSNLRQLA